MFHWYLGVCWANPAIREYVDTMKKHYDDDDVFDWFVYIFKKCDYFGKAKKNNEPILIWKVSRWFRNTKFFKKLIVKTRKKLAGYQKNF